MIKFIGNLKVFAQSWTIFCYSPKGYIRSIKY